MQTSARMNRTFSIARALDQIAIDKQKIQQPHPDFPRDIENSILHVLEIPVVRLPVLTPHTASHYLCSLSGNDNFDMVSTDARPILGLVHVGPPINVILLREDLKWHIANYVLAHELAHIVGEIFIARDLWLKALPDQIHVIQRAFEWKDMDPWLDLQAAVKGLPSRPRAISGRGTFSEPDTSEREIQADLVAREILLPWQAAVQIFAQGTRKEMILLFQQEFALPFRIATGYYEDLRYYLAPSPDTIARLFRPLL